MFYSSLAGFSSSCSLRSSMCSTKVASISNSCCWGSTGVLGATVQWAQKLLQCLEISDWGGCSAWGRGNHA